ETEQLVEYICELPLARQARILDVGTGSGVIIISLAARFPEANLFAVDLSPEALTLACENAARAGLGERIRFSRSNLLEEVEGPYDLIVANLPYIATAEGPELAPEVKHDPAIA